MSLYTKDHDISDGDLLLRWHRHCTVKLRGTNVKSVIGKVYGFYDDLTYYDSLIYFANQNFRSRQCPSRIYERA